MWKNGKWPFLGGVELTTVLTVLTVLTVALEEPQQDPQGFHHHVPRAIAHQDRQRIKKTLQHQSGHTTQSEATSREYNEAVLEFP